MFTTSESEACRRLIELALREDLGDANADPTSAWCFGSWAVEGSAAFVVRQAGVVAGLPAVAMLCERQGLTFQGVVEDGTRVGPGDVVGRVKGAMPAMLGIERIALNSAQHLSGIASLTRQFVDAVAGLPVKILDTRKTLPGWRALAKYAVRAGGGHNHRMGLYDGILIKDNHLAAALPRFRGSIAKLLHEVRREARPGMAVEVEVDSLEQLAAALPEKPDIVLLDNMTLEQLRQAVALRNKIAASVLLEASGGVNLETVRGIAETGVDRISVGALTHSAPALDIGLDYES